MSIKDVNTILFEIWETEKVVFDNKVYTSSEEYLLNGYNYQTSNQKMK